MDFRSPADELADELDRNLNVSPRSDAQLRSPRFVRRRADNRGRKFHCIFLPYSCLMLTFAASILNPTAGHFVVFGARKNGYYSDELSITRLMARLYH